MQKKNKKGPHGLATVDVTSASSIIDLFANVNFDWPMIIQRHVPHPIYKPVSKLDQFCLRFQTVQT